MIKSDTSIGKWFNLFRPVSYRQFIKLTKKTIRRKKDFFQQDPKDPDRKLRIEVTAFYNSDTEKEYSFPELSSLKELPKIKNHMLSKGMTKEAFDKATYVRLVVEPAKDGYYRHTSELFFKKHNPKIVTTTKIA